MLILMASAVTAAPQRSPPPGRSLLGTITEPVAVRLVRSSDPRCAPDRCADWIAVEGQFGPGSSAAFAHMLRLAGRRRLPVLIDSPGGLVGEAMAIGRMIRDRHLDVAVARTVLATCPADRDACRTLTPDGLVIGRPEPRRALCASACPLALAAGTRRFVSPWAHVGVHQYVSFARREKVMRLYRVVTRTLNGERKEISRTLVSERPMPETAVTVRTRATYGDTAAYYARMGIGAGLMPLLRSAPAEGMTWLSSDELLATRLATQVGDDVEVAAPADPAAAAVRPGSPEGPVPSSGSHEIAALIDDAGTAVASYAGHATWTVEREGGQAGTAAAATLVAAVTLDDDAGTLSFRITRRQNGIGPSDLHLEARLLHGGNSPFHQILALETPMLRKDPHAMPDALLSQRDPSPPAVLALTLSDTPQDARKDLAMLAAEQWIDVPVMIDQSRTVRVTFALGESGARAVRDWEAVSTP